VAAGKKKGLLFDSTRCIGCGACYLACKERNRLPTTAQDFLGDDLSAVTYTVVQNRGGRFVRRLCMHCEEPTCVSVCPVGALEKTALGPVIYHADRCIGCRYCMVACPFGIPRYEWRNRRPRVRKCDLCYDRVVAGMSPACAAVCPTGATLFGDRDALIEEARARLRAEPRRYAPHIYGLEEVGGTSVLLVLDVSPESVGYRTNLSAEPLPLLTWHVLKKIPNFVLVGGVLLGGLWWITNRRRAVARAERGTDAEASPQERETEDVLPAPDREGK
jgi:formate dehydrogenase iron-sulfur subunit